MSSSVVWQNSDWTVFLVFEDRGSGRKLYLDVLEDASPDWRAVFKELAASEFNVKAVEEDP